MDGGFNRSFKRIVLMNHLKIKKIIFSIVVVAGILLVQPSGFADTKKLDAQKDSIEDQRGQAKKQIKKLKLLEKLETNKLYKNQQKLEYTQHSLQRNKKEYNNAKAEVAALEKKLDTLLVEHKKHQAFTSKRIVQIFKHKRSSYIDFLLNSSDINSFMDRLYFENIIIAYDKKKLRETKIVAREVLAVKARIEAQKRNLENSIVNINRQQSQIQDAISKNEKLIEKLKTDRATWEKAERDLAKQSKAITVMINQEIVKSAKTGTNVVVTGGFTKPVPGKITSPYGSRIHPIFKRKIFHSGIDIGAPYGTPIKAANSGKVIFVGWYSGYGKVVIIDHGQINGIPTTTLYAHMSVTIAKQGSAVAKGAVIGKVGTTGYSTGPHLHFEVRQRGNPTNPLNFIR